MSKEIYFGVSSGSKSSEQHKNVNELLAQAIKGLGWEKPNFLANTIVESNEVVKSLCFKENYLLIAYFIYVIVYGISL